jgi:hypothetical protein
MVPLSVAAVRSDLKKSVYRGASLSIIMRTQVRRRYRCCRQEERRLVEGAPTLEIPSGQRRQKLRDWIYSVHPVAASFASRCPVLTHIPL